MSNLIDGRRLIWEEKIKTRGKKVFREKNGDYEIIVDENSVTTLRCWLKEDDGSIDLPLSTLEGAKLVASLLELGQERRGGCLLTGQTEKA